MNLNGSSRLISQDSFQTDLFFLNSLHIFTVSIYIVLHLYTALHFEFTCLLFRNQGKHVLNATAWVQRLLYQTTCQSLATSCPGPLIQVDYSKIYLSIYNKSCTGFHRNLTKKPYAFDEMLKNRFEFCHQSIEWNGFILIEFQSSVLTSFVWYIHFLSSKNMPDPLLLASTHSFSSFLLASPSPF